MKGLGPAAAARRDQVFVGLGSNLGSQRQTLSDALAELAQLPTTEVIGVSPLYRSAPLDAPGPDYVNAVARLRTALDAPALLDALQAIERRHGRQRPYHHAPRTLDLDLLLDGPQVLQTDRLTLPHPRLHQRAFVLRPLLDLAPDAVHPQLGRLADWWPSVSGQALARLP